MKRQAGLLKWDSSSEQTSCKGTMLPDLKQELGKSCWSMLAGAASALIPGLEQEMT